MFRLMYRCRGEGKALNQKIRDDALQAILRVPIPKGYVKRESLAAPHRIFSPHDRFGSFATARPGCTTAADAPAAPVRGRSRRRHVLVTSRRPCDRLVSKPTGANAPVAARTGQCPWRRRRTLMTCTADHLLPAALVIPRSLRAAAVRSAESAPISAKMGLIRPANASASAAATELCPAAWLRQHAYTLRRNSDARTRSRKSLGLS
jgi:hypothetical protein